jgi:hypothetical protein
VLAADAAWTEIFENIVESDVTMVGLTAAYMRQIAAMKQAYSSMSWPLLSFHILIRTMKVTICPAMAISDLTHCAILATTVQLALRTILNFKNS